MFNLREAIENISIRWRYKLDRLPSDVYRIDVAIKVGENKFRYQLVYIWQIPDRYFGKPVIFMNSRCGEYSPNLNLYHLLKEAGYGTLSTITVTTDKKSDGSPCETVVCQAAIPVEFVNEHILDKTIFEVAYNADVVEEKYFGGDTN